MSAHEQAGEVDVAALRAAAEGAMAPMTCGGHRNTGSLMRCEECYRRNDASVELRNALTATTVLALLDRLERAEDAVAAIRDALDPEELVCGRLGLTCIDVNPLRSYCRPCRLRAALTVPETRREATESAARVEVAPGATEDTNGAQGGAPGTDNETPAGGTESA